jgi:general secretion pathway protein C
LLSAPLCANVEALIVTESPADPLWSRATVRTRAQTLPSVLQVGHKFSELKLMRIGYNGRAASPAIWFEDSRGNLCQTLLFAEPRAETAPPTSKPPSAPRQPESAPQGIARKIQRVSSSDFLLDKTAFEQILEAPLRWFPGIRFAPSTNGVRIAGVRDGSIAALLGLQNQDRLLSINGFDLSKPEAAIEAYAKLRAKPEFNLKVLRNGTPLVLNYQVR